MATLIAVLIGLLFCLAGEALITFLHAGGVLPEPTASILSLAVPLIPVSVWLWLDDSGRNP